MNLNECVGSTYKGECDLVCMQPEGGELWYSQSDRCLVLGYSKARR